jgi:hypothetical protein
MDKLKDIIRNSNMSTRPEYYSGRGAITCDLNSDILQKIYLGIEKEYGKTAAKNYIKMVQDIKVLSATTFLQELYMLFENNWKFKKKKVQASGISVQKNENGEYDEQSVLSGMLGIFAAMSSGGRDETERIRGGFLHTHGIKEKVVYGYNVNGHYYNAW